MIGRLWCMPHVAYHMNGLRAAQSATQMLERNAACYTRDHPVYLLTTGSTKPPPMTSTAPAAPMSTLYVAAGGTPTYSGVNSTG